MAENLNIGTLINGANEQTDNLLMEKYCMYNSEFYCDINGGLYQWDEMMEYGSTPAIQGICPQGWHLPTDNEWKYLEGTVDSQYGIGNSDWNFTGWRGDDAGGNLKDTASIYWDPPNTGATNTSGFTALGAGYRYVGSSYYNYLINGMFWTSTDSDATLAWHRLLSNTNADVYRDTTYKTYGLSVRCLKYPGTPNQAPDLPDSSIPGNGSIDQSIEVSLSWSCNDPENDPLTYDIYFGTDPNPPLVEKSLPDTAFFPGILDYDSTYYWKIVAQDDHGNLTEGEIWSFTTGWICDYPLVDSRDSKIYNTLLINDQCWMAENLNIGSRIDVTIDQTNNGILEKYCYSDTEDSCEVYGGLYLW